MQEIIKKLEFLMDQLSEKEQKKLFIHKLINLANKLSEMGITDNNIISSYTHITSLLQNRSFKEVKKTSVKLFNSVKEKYGLVEKDYYRNTYLALGLTMGTGIGAAFSSSNSSSIALGITFGLAIGVAIGTAKDKEAIKQNKVY